MTAQKLYAERSVQGIQREQVMGFISAGIGCHAFTVIDALGILSKLLENGFFPEKDLLNTEQYPNTPAIKSALLSLCCCNILEKKGKNYFLSELGQQLSEQTGLIKMLFDGYGELFAQGIPLALEKNTSPEKYMNGASIAEASIQFGEHTVDPLVTYIISKMKLTGTICDLGCGTADRLLKVCNATSLPGLGLDINSEAIRLAKELTQNNPLIQVEKADVSNLDGVWEDVQLAMQSFMTHDIYPDQNCIDMLRSYKSNFPCMKYLLIIDITAPEDDLSSFMPGYDYVHGLQSIETRQHKRTVELFKKAGYVVFEEISIDMPNTYLWILRPQ